MRASVPLLLFAVVLLVGLASSTKFTSKIRYANSMPQFGSAKVEAFLPLHTLFQSVPGGFLTAYTNLTSWLYIFTAQFSTNISALSFPYAVAKDKFYSVFTYQSGANRVTNKIVEDRSTSFNGTTPIVRTINLLQYGFDIDVFNYSNNVEILSNVSYGEVTPYVPVPPGDYQLYWEAANTRGKRNTHGWGMFNVSGDPILHPGSAYTHWVLPAGSFIIQDGVISSRKRSVTSGRTADLKKRRVVERNPKAVQETAKEEAENKEETQVASNLKSR
eukprot:TRINITY_DN1641_c0_g1_i1.p1 TRINITY_DN1641_c0_g1~~TRINITY_DN1641_c0_g1_i1.p1  ORF type:complete len:274 (+),score=63.15 TRINITY_DN1641_c0_g1_i1:293-1114(+)